MKKIVNDEILAPKRYRAVINEVSVELKSYGTSQYHWEYRFNLTFNNDDNGYRRYAKDADGNNVVIIDSTLIVSNKQINRAAANGAFRAVSQYAMITSAAEKAKKRNLDYARQSVWAIAVGAAITFDVLPYEVGESYEVDGEIRQYENRGCRIELREITLSSIMSALVNLAIAKPNVNVTDILKTATSNATAGELPEKIEATDADNSN